MGFSVSASTAIIFAGMFLAVGILDPAVSNGFEQVQDAQVDRDQAQLDMRNTAISITEANEDVITVENTGTTSLKVSEVDLIVDGTYKERSSYETAVEDNGETDLWLPGEELTLNNFNNFSVDERAKIVTEHGISVSTGV